MGHQLDPVRIVETARRLQRRVAERFPDSGLSQVAADVVAVGERGAEDAEWFAAPDWWLRAGVTVCITLLLAVVVGAVAVALPRWSEMTLPEFFQGTEAAINDIIFIGVAIYFLASLETRRKRARALKAFHGLRGLAHIIDMHQLTKDPERVADPESDTPSSPERHLNPFELSRYLDYCSEMLSLLSKTAALYIQRFDDPITISAVNEVENLTTGLSRKIWQKIMILGEP